MLTYIFKAGSNRSLFFQLKSSEALSNFKIFSGVENIHRIPHYDTVKNLMRRIDPVESEKIGVSISRELLRRKSFDKFRFMGEYVLVALDGTQQLTFDKRHCPSCLSTTHSFTDKKGETTKRTYYHHNLLTARMVFSNGITFHIASEYIANDPDRNFNKQDCEIKAAYRLMDKVKKYFPQLKICFLADSLYVNQRIINKCHESNWRYIITLKEGSAPALYRDYMLLKNNSANRRVESTTEEKVTQRTYFWQNNLQLGKTKLNVCECLEQSKSKSTRFMYMTDLLLHSNNIRTVINQGGRQRSKIENETFNEKKNGGYRLEHLYCEDLNAIKNYLTFLSIALTLNQLFEKGIIDKTHSQQLGGRKYITFFLLTEFINSAIEVDLEAIYFHFDSS